MRRGVSLWVAWALRVGAVVLIAISVGLAWLAHGALGESAHPVDSAPSALVGFAVIIALIAAMFLGAGAWTLLGGDTRRGRVLALAAPASVLAVLPWSGVASWGVVINVVVGLVATASWWRVRSRDT
jgi:hypothetical protein